MSVFLRARATCQAAIRASEQVATACQRTQSLSCSDAADRVAAESDCRFVLCGVPFAFWHNGVSYWTHGQNACLQFFSSLVASINPRMWAKDDIIISGTQQQQLLLHVPLSVLLSVVSITSTPSAWRCHIK